MVKKENLERALEAIGENVSEKMETIQEMLDTDISEQALVQKLGLKDGGTVRKFLKELYGYEEEDVFSQEVSNEELAEVSGGATWEETPCVNNVNRALYKNCTESHIRMIDIPSFPNCAGTVEDGSWCYESDACFESAITYVGMHHCTKAWK